MKTENAPLKWLSITYYIKNKNRIWYSKKKHFKTNSEPCRSHPVFAGGLVTQNLLQSGPWKLLHNWDWISDGLKFVFNGSLDLSQRSPTPKNYQNLLDMNFHTFGLQFQVLSLPQSINSWLVGRQINLKLVSIYTSLKKIRAKCEMWNVNIYNNINIMWNIEIIILIIIIYFIYII